MSTAAGFTAAVVSDFYMFWLTHQFVIGKRTDVKEMCDRQILKYIVKI